MNPTDCKKNAISFSFLEPQWHQPTNRTPCKDIEGYCFKLFREAQAANQVTKKVQAQNKALKMKLEKTEKQAASAMEVVNKLYFQLGTSASPSRVTITQDRLDHFEATEGEYENLLEDYFDLAKENKELKEENSRLKKELEESRQEKREPLSPVDSTRRTKQRKV